MEEMSTARRILRCAHNCIFISAVYICLGLALSEASGSGRGISAFMLTGAALLSVVFLMGEALLFIFKGFWKFTPALLLMDAAVFAASGALIPAGDVCSGLLILFVLMLNVFLFYEHNRDRLVFHPSLGGVVVYVPLWMFGVMAKSTEITPVVITCQILELFIFVISHELTNLELAVKGVKDRAYVPVDMINRQNRFELAMFLLPMGALAFLCLLFPYGEAISDMLFSLVSRITSVMVRLFTKKEGPKTGSASGSTSLIPEELFDGESVIPVWFWDILTLICLVIVTVLIVRFLIKLAADFYRRFQDVSFGSDRQVSEFLEPGEKNESADLTGRIRIWDRSPEAVIRRRYIRVIKKQPGADRIAPAHTPLQLELAAMGEEREKHVELHDLYEKARYSGAADAEDAQRVRKLT